MLTNRIDEASITASCGGEQREVAVQLGIRPGNYPYNKIAAAHGAEYVLVLPLDQVADYKNNPDFKSKTIIGLDDPSNWERVCAALDANGHLRDGQKYLFFPERDLYVSAAAHLRQRFGDGARAYVAPDKEALPAKLKAAGIEPLPCAMVKAVMKFGEDAAGKTARDAYLNDAILSIGGFPVVLKATNASAEYGIVPADDFDQLVQGIHRYKGQKTESGAELVWSLQKQADGPEYCIEGFVDREGNKHIVHGGQKFARAMPGEKYQLGGTIGHDHESLQTLEGGRLLELGKRAAEALDFPTGPFTMDIVKTLSNGTLHLIDTAHGRIPGLVVQPSIRKATGYDWADLSYCLQAGKPIPFPEEVKKNGLLPVHMTLSDDDGAVFDEVVRRTSRIHRASQVAYGDAIDSSSSPAMKAYMNRRGSSYAFFEAESSTDAAEVFKAVICERRGGVMKPIECYSRPDLASAKQCGASGSAGSSGLPTIERAAPSPFPRPPGSPD